MLEISSCVPCSRCWSYLLLHETRIHVCRLEDIRVLLQIWTSRMVATFVGRFHMTRFDVINAMSGRLLRSPRKIWRLVTSIHVYAGQEMRDLCTCARVWIQAVCWDLHALRCVAHVLTIRIFIELYFHHQLATTTLGSFLFYFRFFWGSFGCIASVTLYTYVSLSGILDVLRWGLPNKWDTSVHRNTMYLCLSIFSC
jgi:hypothetical protein